jgi:ketosteroid isomerase-like protein
VGGDLGRVPIRGRGARGRGDKVVLLYRQFGRGRGSGVDVEECAGWVYTLRAGKIVRVEMHPDQATALRAAGVSR